mmetsp:Transcript_32189/g.42442  ORF Transcript_32189/g.42442 Transcript_32189/m.42442 type:complete len:786 (-) Transcript_32189:326-2683(-)
MTAQTRFLQFVLGISCLSFHLNMKCVALLSSRSRCLFVPILSNVKNSVVPKIAQQTSSLKSTTQSASQIHMSTITRKRYDLRNPEEAEEYLKKNLEIRDALLSNQVVPVKVYIHPEIRDKLRFSGKQKRPKLFVKPGEQYSVKAIQGYLEAELQKLQGFPYRLGVRPSLASEDVVLVDTETQLRKAFEQSDGNYQLFVEPDPDYIPPPPPLYLENLPDPALSPTMTPVSFFTFNQIEDPKDYVQELHAVWGPFGAQGRIYVAKEGINAQMAVPTTVLSNFEQACRSLPEFNDIYINKDDPLTREEYDEIKPFSKLHIRARDQIVADGGIDPLNWKDCGPGLKPMEWHKALENNDAVILDCRNTYETDIGIFDKALPVNTTYFRQTWDAVDEILKDHPKDKPVMMYCTGGIRCIKVGAYVKQKLGFDNVQRLDGGIINYAQTITKQAEDMASKFKGKNYVFDQRLGQDITDDVLSECDQCGTPCNSHTNCANTKCHVRFIQCSNCGSTYQGCCSRGCQHQANIAAAGGDAEKVATPNPLKLDTLPKDQQHRLNRVFDTVMEDYAEKYSSEEPTHLNAIRKATATAMPYAAHMVSGHLQGRILTMLTKLTGAKNVLEIGTFTGYSALCFAEALPEDGVVTTIEIDEKVADIAEDNFKTHEESWKKIDLRRGRALDILDQLIQEKTQYDIIFIDGDKKKYSEYYDIIFKKGLLKKTGIVLADNVLYKGGVIEFDEDSAVELSTDKKEKRQQKIAQSLHSFNQHVKEDTETEQVILPIRDGLTVIRWKV